MSHTEQNTTEQLKEYLKRLSKGESLELVRKDFVQNFSDVDASEIMEAEQQLIKEGAPLKEVQKLCDVHSALFHGATREEKIMNAEKAVTESVVKRQAEDAAKKAALYQNKQVIANELKSTEGHPLNTFVKENAALRPVIADIRRSLEDGNDVTEKLSTLRQIAIHYAKKGDLLYPVLKVRYEVSGPSDVMWTVDDEIRDEMAALGRIENHDETWTERLLAVITRAEEMIFKEENILFPICAVNFKKEEWYGIYQDAKDYAPVFGVTSHWPEAEEAAATASGNPSETRDNEVVMPGGHLTIEQLTAMLNTLPLEISFVDAENINRYFNEGPKVFKRPQMAIDREVFSCHPPKIEAMVRKILDDFRSGKRDQVPVWMEKQGKPFLVNYMAVRDKEGSYLGTVEVVQDMTFAKEHFEK